MYLYTTIQQYTNQPTEKFFVNDNVQRYKRSFLGVRKKKEKEKKPRENLRKTTYILHRCRDKSETIMSLFMGIFFFLEGGTGVT